MKKPVTKPEGKVHIHLLVTDMKRSIDFYTTVLGFFYDHGIREMAWLKRGDLQLTLSPADSENSKHGAGYFGWSFDSAEQLEQHYQDLYSRRQRLSSPPDIDGGRPYFFLYDPDDNPISFSWVPMDYPDKTS